MLDRAKFQNPSNTYREAPFWSWNDWLEIPELLRQIGEMDNAGWGGFFMHTRVGLETPYMGKEYMACVKACVAEASKRGMDAWLYDEDKWPSGFAGGAVPKKGPAYREKALLMREHGIPDPPECVKVLAIYSVKRHGDSYTDLREIAAGQENTHRGRGRTILYFYQRTSPLDVPHFNGTSYVDTLNPEMTKAFIASTHEKYRRLLGKQFGKTIPGIFTDEPACLDAIGQRFPGVPWTTGFPAYFKKLNGYAIGPHIPSLFIEVGDWRKVRYDYRRTVQSRFVESFSKPLGDWCSRHNLKLTGHYLIEDNFIGQMAYSGGGVMPHYEYMHAPGIDHLGYEQLHPTTAKQVSSVANQLGKERVLSELYGCSGHRSTFEDRKWLADWHLVHGINLLNPHLSLYSMRGERKRDYPPNIYYQQPYWKHNRVLSDYIGRVAYAMTRGRRVIDVLLLNSIESAWMQFAATRPAPEVDELDRQFKAVQTHLLADTRDYDLGDEEIIARHGHVDDGIFVIDRSRYTVVVLPPMTVLRETTLAMLEQFVAEGGSLVAVRPTPTYVQGVKGTRRIATLLKSAQVVDLRARALCSAIDREIPREVTVRATAGKRVDAIHLHQRTQGKTDLYFLTNSSRTTAHKLTVSLRGEGALTQWDTSSGKKEPLPARWKEGSTVFRTTLEPAGSLLLSRELGKPSVPPAPRRAAGPARRIKMNGEWQLRRLDPNALTIDTCQYRHTGFQWSTPVPVWKAQRAMTDAYGTFRALYTFEAKAAPNGACELVIESPEHFVISVNGVGIASNTDRYYRDISFKRLNIAGLVGKGTNVVELTASGKQGHRLESIYIIGDFAVTNRANRSFALTTEKKTIPAVDVVKEGYPFFAGTFELSRSFSLTQKPAEGQLRFGALDFTHAEVLVNGHRAGAAYWHPLTVDLAAYLKKGRNTLTIRLTNNLRNLLGPHHQKSGDQNWTGPDEFYNVANWTDRYDFNRFGLGGVELVIR